jgi:cell division protein FtsI/penicillin-binding protein 2
MGMAASQARLLTITARMHDVEYKAQSIQNAKIQLSTQSDQVYQEYLEALDATTLTVDDINGNTITANFNNLVGKNGVETGNNYALRTSNGQLIVEEEYNGQMVSRLLLMMLCIHITKLFLEGWAILLLWTQ